MTTSSTNDCGGGNCTPIPPGQDEPITDDEAARIEAARDAGDDGAGTGLERWGRADPRDPDVADRRVRVMRAVAIAYERRKMVQAARRAEAARGADPPGGVSATGVLRE